MDITEEHRYFLGRDDDKIVQKRPQVDQFHGSEPSLAQDLSALPKAAPRGRLAAARAEEGAPIEIICVTYLGNTWTVLYIHLNKPPIKPGRFKIGG